MIDHFPLSGGISQFRCDRCLEWWQISGGIGGRCAVSHPPNSCCHFGQMQLTRDGNWIAMRLDNNTPVTRQSGQNDAASGKPE